MLYVDVVVVVVLSLVISLNTMFVNLIFISCKKLQIVPIKTIIENSFIVGEKALQGICIGI